MELKDALEQTTGETGYKAQNPMWKYPLPQPPEAARAEFRLRGHFNEIAELAEAARMETYLDNPEAVENALRKILARLKEAETACTSWKAALATTEQCHDA